MLLEKYEYKYDEGNEDNYLEILERFY